MARGVEFTDYPMYMEILGWMPYQFDHLVFPHRLLPPFQHPHILASLLFFLQIIHVIYHEIHLLPYLLSQNRIGYNVNKSIIL